MRVVAARSVGRRSPSPIHLHLAERQHEYAKCEQACDSTAERSKHGLSICMTGAFRTLSPRPPGPPNVLPFSGVGAANPSPRFYTTSLRRDFDSA